MEVIDLTVFLKKKKKFPTIVTFNNCIEILSLGFMVNYRKNRYYLLINMARKQKIGRSYIFKISCCLVPVFNFTRFYFIEIYIFNKS